MEPTVSACGVRSSVKHTYRTRPNKATSTSVLTDVFDRYLVMSGCRGYAKSVPVVLVV